MALGHGMGGRQAFKGDPQPENTAWTPERVMLQKPMPTHLIFNTSISSRKASRTAPMLGTGAALPRTSPLIWAPAPVDVSLPPLLVWAPERGSLPPQLGSLGCSVAQPLGSTPTSVPALQAQPEGSQACLLPGGALFLQTCREKEAPRSHT